jgi:hypothetical protein
MILKTAGKNSTSKFITMTQKEIPKQITEELFYLFESLYTKARIKNIAERYGFEEKLSNFSSIVAKTLYGERPIGQLSKSLVKEIGVSEEVAQYIEIELDKEIFSERRLEFNVVQGFVSPDEIELVNEGEEGAEGAPTEAPSKMPVPQKETGSDPIASSILGENRRPGAQSDPYREPIDEE